MIVFPVSWNVSHFRSLPFLTSSFSGEFEDCSVVAVPVGILGLDLRQVDGGRLQRRHHEAALVGMTDNVGSVDLTLLETSLFLSTVPNPE